MVEKDEHRVKYWQRIHNMICRLEPLDKIKQRIEQPDKYVTGHTLADPKALAARNASLWILVGRKQLELEK